MSHLPKCSCHGPLLDTHAFEVASRVAEGADQFAASLEVYPHADPALFPEAAA